MWEGFGSRGLQGGASVRRDQKLLPCLTEATSASSRIDLSLAKFDPISAISSISVITYLRKGEKCCAAAVREE